MVHSKPIHDINKFATYFSVDDIIYLYTCGNSRRIDYVPTSISRQRMMAHMVMTKDQKESL